MKLIDPNELEKVLRPILTDESCPLHIAAEIDMNLDLMPKVDAVPVVRCKDCRWRDDQSGSTAWMPCRALMTPNDFYCLRGERKDDDHETD